MTRAHTSWDYLFQGNHFKAKRVCDRFTDQFDCIIYVGYRDKDHDYQVISWSHARKWPRVYGSLLTKYTHDFDCSNSSYLRTEHTIKNLDLNFVLRFPKFISQWHKQIWKLTKHYFNIIYGLTQVIKKKLYIQNLWRWSKRVRTNISTIHHL